MPLFSARQVLVMKIRRCSFGKTECACVPYTAEILKIEGGIFEQVRHYRLKVGEKLLAILCNGDFSWSVLVYI